MPDFDKMTGKDLSDMLDYLDATAQFLLLAGFENWWQSAEKKMKDFLFFPNPRNSLSPDGKHDLITLRCKHNPAVLVDDLPIITVINVPFLQSPNPLYNTRTTPKETARKIIQELFRDALVKEVFNEKDTCRISFPDEAKDTLRQIIHEWRMYLRNRMRAVMAGQNAGKKLPLSKAKVRHLKRIGRNGGCVTRDNPATVAKAVENVRRDVGKTGFKMLPRCRHEIREMKLTIEPEALAKHVRGKKRKP